MSKSATITAPHVPGAIVKAAHDRHDQAVREPNELLVAAQPLIDAHQAIQDQIDRGEPTTADEVLQAWIARNRAVLPLDEARAKVAAAAAAIAEAEARGRHTDLEAEARDLFGGELAQEVAAAMQALRKAQERVTDLAGPWAEAVRAMGTRLAEAGFPRLEGADALDGVRWTGTLRADRYNGEHRWVPADVDGFAVDGKDHRDRRGWSGNAYLY